MARNKRFDDEQLGEKDSQGVAAAVVDAGCKIGRAISSWLFKSDKKNENPQIVINCGIQPKTEKNNSSTKRDTTSLGCSCEKKVTHDVQKTLRWVTNIPYGKHCPHCGCGWNQGPSSQQPNTNTKGK